MRSRLYTTDNYKPLMHLSAGDVYPVVGTEPLGPFSKPCNPTTRSPPPLHFQKPETNARPLKILEVVR
jgi:hypothetical protein